MTSKFVVEAILYVEMRRYAVVRALIDMLYEDLKQDRLFSWHGRGCLSASIQKWQELWLRVGEDVHVRSRQKQTCAETAMV